jgi:PAS domain S-box-containing protein
VTMDWIEYLPFPIVVTDEGNGIQYYNSIFAELVGSEVEGPGVSFPSLFSKWEEQVSHIVLAEYKGKKFLLLYKKMMWESHNLFLYFLLNDTWAHELKEKVIKLDKLNQELDAIIESSYDVIYITDSKGKTLRTNSAIERITSIPKKYYIGKNVNELVNRGILKESVTFKVLKQKKPVSIIQEGFAGKETMITGSPVFNAAGEVEKIVTNIRDLSELNALRNELEKMRKLNKQYQEELEKLKGKQNNNGVVLQSHTMRDLYDMAERIANVDATVLILGETGVGKDVLARHIYRSSSRYKKGEFVKVNCGAIPHELLESELFGYEAGAFTGANRLGKAGMFELADKGVLFLDEVGELPLPLQVKLLRALQEKQIQRIGSTKLKDVDVRVIAATNRNLKEMVGEGKFREDLFYRLNVLPLYIPPLRERRDDILPLIYYYLDKLNNKYSLSKKFSQEVKDFFYHYDWPGNVRELANLVERLILIVTSEIITIKDLPEEYKLVKKKEKTSSSTKVMTLKEVVEIAERKVLAAALEKFSSTYRIAEVLGTSQPTIVRKLKKYNL